MQRVFGLTKLANANRKAMAIQSISVVLNIVRVTPGLSVDPEPSMTPRDVSPDAEHDLPEQPPSPRASVAD